MKIKIRKLVTLLETQFTVVESLLNRSVAFSNEKSLLKIL